MAADRARSPHQPDERIAAAINEDAAQPFECRIQSIPLGIQYVWPHRFIKRRDDGPNPRRLHAFWPSGTESFTAAGFKELIENVDWWEAAHENRFFLQPLLDADFPLGPAASLILATGLGCKNAGEHGLAVDVAITAIEDGRLTDANLGRALEILFASRVVSPGRWAKTLADVARPSALHTYIVQQAICQSLRRKKGKPPKTLAPYLELLVELTLSLDAPIDDDQTRDFLSQIKGGGKAAKAAETLLAQTEPLSQAKTQEIMQLAIEGRIARAQRWAGW